jgi:hypothetical protein
MLWQAVLADFVPVVGKLGFGARADRYWIAGRGAIPYLHDKCLTLLHLRRSGVAVNSQGYKQIALRFQPHLSGIASC